MYGSVKKCLVDERPGEFADCVRWARIQFQENYHNTIKQLLYNFPKDQVSFLSLTIIPRARMGSESIAHEAEG